MLAKTRQYRMFNQKISEARLAGKSWRQITAAANGKNNYSCNPDI